MKKLSLILIASLMLSNLGLEAGEKRKRGDSSSESEQEREHTPAERELKKHKAKKDKQTVAPRSEDLWGNEAETKEREVKKQVGKAEVVDDEMPPTQSSSSSSSGSSLSEEQEEELGKFLLVGTTSGAKSVPGVSNIVGEYLEKFTYSRQIFALHPKKASTYFKAIALSPDNRKIATILSEGNTVTIYDVTANLRKTVATLNYHKKILNSIAFSHDGSQLIIATNDDIEVRNTKNYAWEGSFFNPKTPGVHYLKVVTNRTTDVFATLDSKSNVTLWDSSGKYILATLPPNYPSDTRPLPNTTPLIALSSNGKLLAVATAIRQECIFGLWDVATLKPITTRSIDMANEFQCLALSPDGSLLAIGSIGLQSNDIDEDDYDEIDYIELWDTTEKTPKRLVRHEYPRKITSLAFSNDGRFLASGDFNGFVGLWNIPSMELYETISKEKLDNSQQQIVHEVHDDMMDEAQVSTLLFSSDNSTLIANIQDANEIPTVGNIGILYRTYQGDILEAIAKATATVNEQRKQEARNRILKLLHTEERSALDEENLRKLKTEHPKLYQEAYEDYERRSALTEW